MLHLGCVLYCVVYSADADGVMASLEGVSLEVRSGYEL